MFAGWLVHNTAFQVILILVLSLWFFGWVGTLFLSSTRVIFAAAFDRVLPDRAAEVSEKRKVPFYSLILMLLPAVILAAVYAYSSTFRTYTLDATLVIAVTYLFSAIAVVLLPWLKPDLWRASPASRIKVLGVPIVPVAGVVTIGLLVFNLYEWLSNDLYFVNSHDSLIFMGAMYVLAILVYVVARVVRSRQGIDLGLINKEIPGVLGQGEPLRPRALGRRPLRLMRPLDDRADGPVELDDVLPGDLGGLPGVAVGQRLEQFAVLRDVRRHARQPVQEQAPDAGGQVAVADQGVLEVRVVRRGVDGAVDPHVQGHQLAWLAAQLRRLFGQLGGQRLKNCPVGRGGVPGRAGRRGRLDHRADLEDVRQVGDVDLGRERAAPRVGHHKPFVFQPLERLPDRGPAQPQAQAQVFLVDRCAGPDGQPDQQILDLPVGQVGQRARPARAATGPVRVRPRRLDHGIHAF
jgi:hypothetical protein